MVGLVLAGWMAWRIVDKAGLPGWAGLGAILLTLTAVGTVVPLVLLWVFAFMRWPRDEMVPAIAGPSPAPAAPRRRPCPIAAAGGLSAAACRSPSTTPRRPIA